MEDVEYSQNVWSDPSDQLHRELKITGTLLNSRHCPEEVKEKEKMSVQKMLEALLARYQPEGPQEDTAYASLKKENAELK
ncbi:hypothetical protein MMC32_007553, partial [Xylographa parallela]|nr:hypothetical protein [Xylographa parallela]